MIELKFEELKPEYKKGLEKAAANLVNSYDPHTGFLVSSVILCANGEMYEGNNFASAASSATICAERSAIAHANSHGNRDYTALFVVAKGKHGNTTEPTLPCGVCRQVIKEAADISGRDLEIIAATTLLDKVRSYTLTELLPEGFGPKDMGIDATKYRKSP